MAAPYLTSFKLVKPAELTYDTRPDAFATRSRRCLVVGHSPVGRGRRPRGRSRVPSPDRRTPGHSHLSQRSPSLAEVADTPAKRTSGLMFRDRLAPDRGMLFVFEGAGERRFW